MTRWLLAAEVDKIQDFIFRSSRLVQVAGGSGLVERFCKEVPPLLIEQHIGRRPKDGDEDIVIAAGGSFRLTFDDEKAAKAVRRDLAEAYYRATDGSLTVAEPQPYDDTNFAEASKKAEADLRAKKADRRGQSTATAHLPFIAFCASCGILLATDYRIRHRDDQPNYLCTTCYKKATERDMIWQAPERERFLSYFFNALRRTELAEDLPDQLDRDLFPQDADAVGQHDPRGYVAYLVADGNGMGVLFSHCQDVQTMQQFSNALTGAIWTALARATAKLAGRLWSLGTKAPIPVTPLIVGGDDLFALVAAPYALDFARQVCLEFEDELCQRSEELQLTTGTADRPTMAAAVVICKKNYPYALAHRQGKALLDRTKQLTRAARLRDGVNLSAVDLTVVLGGDVDLGDEVGANGREHIVPSFSPYWTAREPLSAAAERYALDLQQLLEARYKLRGLPGKRRAELRDLFVARLPGEEGRREDALKDLAGDWQPRLDALLRRIERRPDDRKALESALAMLGDPEGTYYPWRRCVGRSKAPFAHALPDLLEVWDFAQDLARSLEDYEEEGR